MGPSVDLKSIRKINAILHERSRLSIVLALVGRDSLSFSELKALLEMTDGNLSIHLRTLEENGYLTTTRSRLSGKRRKICQLTPEGRLEFERYLSLLDDLVHAARSGSNGPPPSPP